MQFIKKKNNACDEARELPHLDSFARLVHFELKVINRNLSCSSPLQHFFFELSSQVFNVFESSGL